jgi:hypothetical protein
MPDLVALTQAHRADLEQLTGLAASDLEVVWRDFNSAVVARDSLLDVLPQLVETYGSAAATLAADWYDELRAAGGVPGRFVAVTAVLPDRGRTDALARWAVEPLFSAIPDRVSALAMASGGLQRIIANADRETVTASAVEDPRAAGWRRVGVAGDCGWCQTLVGRGAVYREATAKFLSHDRCRCSAVPQFI